MFKGFKSYHGKRRKMTMNNKQTRVWEERVNLKLKAIPIQTWTGSEGSRSLRLPDFKTIGTGRW